MRWVILFGLLLSAPVRAGWGYLPAGRFPEPGRCTSAGLAGGELVVACASGVWRGPPDQLRKVIDCHSQGGHVRSLGGGRFAAGTDCGLFLLEPERAATRVPLPDRPQALAADGRGGLVVVAGRKVYAWQPGAATPRPLGPWPDPAPPFSLAVGERGPVSQGLRVVAFMRRPARFRPPTPGARGALATPARLVWVGPRGRVWLQALDGPILATPRSIGRVAHRVMRVKDLGGRRVWTADRERWTVLAGRGRLAGWLPAGWGELLAVRQADGRGPPWLVGRGVVLRPVPSRRGRRRACPLAVVGLDGPGRFDPLAGLGPSPDWTWLLPEVTLRAWGATGSASSWAGPVEDLRVQRDWGVGLVLSWPLGRAAVDRDAALEQLRVEILRLERLRLADLERLAADRRRLCLEHGSGADPARLDAVVQQLRALGEQDRAAP